MSDDFVRSRRDQMVDHHQAAAVVASGLSWPKMVSRVAPKFTHRERPLRHIEDLSEMLGPFVRISGGEASNAGRPTDQVKYKDWFHSLHAPKDKLGRVSGFAAMALATAISLTSVRAENVIRVGPGQSIKSIFSGRRHREGWRRI
ncbi:MAG: hypothetical protein IPF55_16205 [Rhodoferax sp.]|nr:hypothetical protein [Rhodoferax sp.]